MEQRQVSGNVRLPVHSPMGTILGGGEFDAVMAVVAACFRQLERDCGRIAMTLEVDYRAGGESRLRSKVDKVQRHLGRALKTG